jgi:hypothetical protein
VDLGLRLDEAGRPAHPRLLTARDLGAATVRLALTGPSEMDDQAVGWLRLAYQQNAVPPPRRKPAPRPRPEAAPLRVVIEASGLTGRTFQAEPGLPRYANVHLALRSTSKDRPSLATPGHPWRATDPVPGDAPSGRWEAEITLRRDADALDFGGPFVRGDRTDRHLGLVWGDVSADGTFRLIHGSKLKLAQVDPALVEEALSSGSELIARIRYSDEAGRPLRPPDLSWSVAQS